MGKETAISFTGFDLKGEYCFLWPIGENYFLFCITPCYRPGWFRRFWVWFLLGAYWEKI